MERLEARGLMALAGPTLLDGGFEVVSAGTGFRYAPTGSAWTFSPMAALSANASAFTAGNPNAPDGGQVAALQNNGSVTQTINDWATGTYTISFSAAQRAQDFANLPAQHQDIQVLIDDTVVGTFTPTGTSYENDATTPLMLTAGAHTITFQGLDTVGGDNTAFIDAVAINRPTTGPVLGDPGFEAVNVGTGFQYAPTGSAWTFSGPAAVSGNGSAFTSGNTAAPEGSQVAVIQDQGSISQSVANWAAGTYTISFRASDRGNQEGGYDNDADYYEPQTFEVLIDNTIVGTYDPGRDVGHADYFGKIAYQAYTTPPLAVTAGTHTITFQGLDTFGNDATDFVEEISINSPQPMTIGDAGFEAIYTRQYEYTPSNSSWTFLGGSGLSSTDSAMSSGDYSPQGNQAAFIQTGGSISQSVANWAAGTYSIAFLGASRFTPIIGDYDPDALAVDHQKEDFQVLIDDTVVGTFLPTTTDYKRFVTTQFTVAAGAHTITFRGLDTVGGDNTAFIDAVSIR